MPENLVVELEASTMMESHRDLKELLTSEKSLNSTGSHEKQRQKRAHCQGRAKEEFGGVFQRSCDQAQLHHISKELGNLNLSSALFLVLRIAIKSTGTSIMLKNIEPAQYDRTKASRNGEEVSE